MEYKQVLNYLFAQLPMFHRIGAAAYKADLSNTQALMKLLDHPENGFKSVHVAGTNGKGSTSHMLAAIFQKAGYKTGLYTSPHLLDFRERIRINGIMIPEGRVVEFVKQHQAKFDPIGLSFFEWTVGLAFDYFRNERVDIAIVETGLGGRLDSTNVIQPDLSVITNIGWDHANLLGDTLEKIAGEKAGIIKPGVPVVVGERQAESAAVFTQRAQQLQSPLVMASDHWQCARNTVSLSVQTIHVQRDHQPVFEALQLDLTGGYQLKNVLTVLEAVHQLRSSGWQLSDSNIVDALADVRRLTGLNGRWQVLSEQPLIICDVGHNVDGIREVVTQINSTLHRNLHMVFGMVKDKDVLPVLRLLPASAAYYFCEPALPRALPAEELSTQAKQAGLEGDVFHSVSDALAAARDAAQPDDLIVVGGSTFVVAEVAGLKFKK